MKRAAVVLGAVVAAVAPAKAAETPVKTKRKHVPGCRSHACDDRIGHRWALKHPPQRPSTSALASWYGPGFFGNSTACGQTLTPSTLGVAHKTLACGTRVLVCAARCLSVRVIDRGPYVAGREYDLTAATARAIGFGGVGTIRVRVG